MSTKNRQFESKEYLVTWEIDIFNADNARDAARRALIIQRDRKSCATYFTVKNKRTGELVEIDLEKEES